MMICVYKMGIADNFVVYVIGLLGLAIITNQTQYIDYCISPINTTSIDCSGISPNIILMPNISSVFHQYTAIPTATPTSDIRLYLANVTNLPFYMLRESDPQPRFTLNSLTITPYYCIMNTLNKMNQNCYNDKSYIPIVYLKSDEFKVYLMRFLEISNIMIDGSDLIKQYYPIGLSDNALKCVSESNNGVCCNSSNNDLGVICKQFNQVFEMDWSQNQGLFNFEDNEGELGEEEGNYSIIEIRIVNIKLKNLHFHYSSSFILINTLGCNITFTNIELDKVYFFGGFLAIQSTKQALSSPNEEVVNNPKYQVNIDIKDCIFKNFNLYNKTKAITNTSIPDGYILRINTSISYYQNINIVSSVFESMISSKISICQNKSFFRDVMDLLELNDFKSAYGSNLLLQHTINYNPVLQSSAILIEILNGILNLDSNTFESIIGYSGAVLGINQLTSISDISIVGNVFKNNFAIMNGATIRIITYTENYFQSYKCGKQITITNNTFSNNIGCSLSYANIFLICSGWTKNTLIMNTQSYIYPTVYLESSSSTSSSNIDEFNDYKARIIKVGTGTTLYQVNLESNIFNCNFLSLSNGIAIHGYPIVNIAYNIFKDNSILIESFGRSLLFNYTLFDQKPFNNIEFYELSYLASSPIYIASASWLTIHDNLFQNNSNVFSGDFQYGSQITLRDIIVFKDYIKIYSNVFCYNRGLPYEIRFGLNDVVLNKGNGITLPLIVFNRYEISNSELLNWGKTSGIGLLAYETIPYITLRNCSFQFNEFVFDYSIQTYHYDKGLYSNLNKNPSYKQAFIRILKKDELYSSNSSSSNNEKFLFVSIINSEFLDNKLKTGGCGLFASLSLNLTLENTIFLNNSIYEMIYMPINGEYSSQDSVTSVKLSMINDGLICLNTLVDDNFGQYIDYISLNITNCTFENNQGSILNKFGDVMISIILINNTIFKNNTSNSSALIYSGVSSILNIALSVFIENKVAYGCIASFYGYAYIGFHNRFESNIGYHANVIFLEESYGVENYSTISNHIAGLGIQYIYFDNPTTAQSSVIYLTKSSFDSWYLTIVSNTAAAGIFYASSAFIYLEGCIIANNTYPSYTDSITSIIALLTSSSGLFCMNCLIQNNTGIGGSPKLFKIGLFVNYVGIINFTNCIISENLLTNHLTILQSISAKTIINITTFHNNIASNDSQNEPNLIIGNYGYFIILNSVFSHNSNIMSIASASIRIYNALFENNNQVINKKIELAMFLPIEIAVINSVFRSSGSDDIKLKSGYLLSIVQQIGILIKNVTFCDINYESGAIIQITGYSSLNLENSRFLNVSFNKITNGAIIIASDMIQINITNTIFDSFNRPSTHIMVDSSSKLKFFLMNTKFYNSTSNPVMMIMEARYILMSNIEIIANPNLDKYLINDENYENLSIISGISISKFFEIHIIDSIFRNNVYTLGTLQLTFQLLNSRVLIVNTTFEDNIALLGGGITIFVEVDYMEMIIENCTFYGNMARNKSNSLIGSQLYYGKGGAIYYSCSRNMNYICNMTILDTIFMYNKASIAGGAIYWDYFPPYNNTGLIFMNNTARYGDDLASYPVYMYPTMNEDLDKSGCMNYDPIWFMECLLGKLRDIKAISPRIVSGNSPIDDIIFGLYDIYGQIDPNDNQSNIFIMPIQNSNDNYSIRANPSLIQVIQGRFSITKFSLDYYPMKNSTITFTSPSIFSLPNGYLQVLKELFNETLVDSIHELNIQDFNMVLSFIDCPIGYIFSISTSNDHQYGICTLCPNGTYSLDPTTFQKQNEKKCLACLYDILKSCSGANIYLQPGYWRMNATADVILKCSSEAYCPGSMNNTDFTSYNCGSNTRGNLCNQCRIGSAKFGIQDSCMDCSQDNQYYLLLFAMIIIQIIFIAYSVSCTMNESNEYKEKNEIIDKDELKSNLLKIMTNYTQVVSLINSFNVNYPSILIDGSSILSYWSIASDQYFSFDCFIILISTNLAIRILNIKLLGIFTSPIIGSIFACIIWAVSFKIKKQKIIHNADFQNKVTTSIVILIYTLQPNLLKYGFILFNCINLYRKDQPIYFLKSDYDFRCWDNYHFKWALCLGLTNILLWGIFIPLGMLYHLYINRPNLNDNSIKLKYAFVYKGYKQDIYFWEFVVLFRKFILIAITIFLNLLSSTLQIMSAIFIMALFLVLQIHVKPFKAHILNVLEAKSLFSSLLITFMTLYFLTDSDRYVGIDIMILGVIGFGYGYFVIAWIWYFGNVIKEDVLMNIRKLQGVIDKLKRYCWCLNRIKNKIHLENSQFNTINIKEISEIMPKMHLPALNNSNEVVYLSHNQNQSELKINESQDKSEEDHCIIHHRKQQQQQQQQEYQNHRENINESPFYFSTQNKMENPCYNLRNIRIQAVNASNLNDIPKPLASKY